MHHRLLPRVRTPSTKARESTQHSERECATIVNVVAQPASSRCIYCLEDKPNSCFNGREYVVPQAFGTFEPRNLVLKCVCDSCNTYFGKHLDRKMGRDSAEGFDRFQRGLRSANEFKSFGRDSTSHLEFQEGILQGVRGHVTANGGDSRTLGVRPFPQVLFSKTEAGPWEAFRLESVPTKDELIARGYEASAQLFIRSFEVDDLIAVLAERGYAVESFACDEVPLPNGRVHVENVVTIGEPELRAATKIALNVSPRSGPG